MVFHAIFLQGGDGNGFANLPPPANPLAGMITNPGDDPRKRLFLPQNPQSLLPVLILNCLQHLSGINMDGTSCRAGRGTFLNTFALQSSQFILFHFHTHFLTYSDRVKKGLLQTLPA